MSKTDIFDIALYKESISDITQRKKAEEILRDLKISMQEELKKCDSFTARLVIITDTLENISNLLHGRKLVSYETFRMSRRILAKPIVKLIKKKGLKKVKRYKRWKN